ncbi:E3 ubiquitin-protein ligase RSL1 [Brassica napus]|uniref:E3 ubiquitin-protein ligase RSL1 n=1 Tax=Brassica napus TaxID=3708 RepID=UPI0006AA8C0B|nr:E3 ubiquitin-protein ligase RSL1 [Brassica napus]
MNDGSSSSSSNTKMDLDVLVDESYFSALFDYDEVFPISDVNYASELHFQEALFSSLIASAAKINNHPQIQRSFTTVIKQEPVVKIENEPLEPSRRLCMICMDEKPSSDMFRGSVTCTHAYCTQCTIRYVANKIKENSAKIKCPDVDCTRSIEPYMCRDLIPKDVFERWEKILCESLISSWDKLYCPFKDCSSVMILDDVGGNNANVTQTECPSCHRMFCAQCKVAWHVGVGCEEFQMYGNTKKKSSDEEDALLVQMATNKQWRRCPSCKFYVEKVDGCMHIKCRCGFQFCYGCGSVWASNHACQIRT